MRKLYSALLGREPEEGIMEEHRLVYVAAGDEDEAKILAKAKWSATNVHVDGVEVIDNVDGYSVLLER